MSESPSCRKPPPSKYHPCKIRSEHFFLIIETNHWFSQKVISITYTHDIYYVYFLLPFPSALWRPFSYTWTLVKHCCFRSLAKCNFLTQMLLLMALLQFMFNLYTFMVRFVCYKLCCYTDLTSSFTFICFYLPILLKHGVRHFYLATTAVLVSYTAIK
jgi:hypothetical protein